MLYHINPLYLSEHINERYTNNTNGGFLNLPGLIGEENKNEDFEQTDNLNRGNEANLNQSRFDSSSLSTMEGNFAVSFQDQISTGTIYYRKEISM